MLFRAQQLAGFRFAKNEARRTVAVSAKEPGWPKHESIRFESSGHRERAALVRLQGNLLGQHDIPDGQVAPRHKTEPELRTASSVDLADVRRRAREDPVPSAGVAAGDLEISAFRQPRPLLRRQPLPQKPQRSALRSPFGAVSDEESPYGSPARGFARP